MVHTEAANVGASAFLGVGFGAPALPGVGTGAPLGVGVGIPASCDVGVLALVNAGVPAVFAAGVGADGSPLMLAKHTDLSTTAAQKDKPDKLDTSICHRNPWMHNYYSSSL